MKTTMRTTPGFGTGTPTSKLPKAAGAGKPSAGHDFDEDLWRRINAMDLDDPTAETPISKRLQAEHKWGAAETDRAIKEYKRFLYLTQRAGFEVTPSRPVDLVWHEHLMHTEHYWGTLCREVLRNDLHHKPGSGGTLTLAYSSLEQLDMLCQRLSGEAI